MFNQNTRIALKLLVSNSYLGDRCIRQPCKLGTTSKSSGAKIPSQKIRALSKRPEEI
jgi:hypothetical protein